jgi:hypothetical protein
MNRIKTKYMYRWLIQLICLLFISSGLLEAQVIKKEVYVVTSFKPEVADVDKISSLPAIDDTTSFKMHADYTVLPSRLRSTYVLRPIKPATMIGTPLDKLYKSYLKIGLGNYVTPLVEFSIHSLRSKEYSIGAYFFHKSSYSDLELDNGRKVPAGYGINELAFYGKYFFKDVTWSADAGLNTHRLRCYGININDSLIFPGTVDIETKDIKQSYTTVYAQTKIYSTAVDSNSFQYSLGMKGEYFNDYHSTTEPHFNLNASISHMIKNFRVGLDGVMNYYSLTDTSGIYKENLLCIRPFVMKRGNEWEVRLAAKIFIENVEKSKTYIFPDANIRFQVINKALVTYFGVDGYLQDNNYQEITLENPYVLSGINVKNTKHSFVAYVGIDGQLSSKAAYRIDVRFDATEYMYFYVNDSITEFENQFAVVYDNTDLIKYYAEFNWSPVTYLTFFAKANYSDYKMIAENKPWHKPAFDMDFTARYNFKEKIYSEIDFLIFGKRYAKNYLDEVNPYELEPVYDLNLKLEYKYSNILTAFVHFYNLLSSKYYLWNQYPSQRLNILVGVTYKF